MIGISYPLLYPGDHLFRCQGLSIEDHSHSGKDGFIESPASAVIHVGSQNNHRVRISVYNLIALFIQSSQDFLKGLLLFCFLFIGPGDPLQGRCRVHFHILKRRENDRSFWFFPPHIGNHRRYQVHFIGGFSAGKKVVRKS